MGVVAPIAALGVAVPVCSASRPATSPRRGRGSACSWRSSGSTLASGPELSGDVSTRPVVLAGVRGGGFGLALFCLDRGARSSTLLTLWGMRLTSVVVFVVRRPGRPAPSGASSPARSPPCSPSGAATWRPTACSRIASSRGRGEHRQRARLALPRRDHPAGRASSSTSGCAGSSRSGRCCPSRGAAVIAVSTLDRLGAHRAPRIARVTSPHRHAPSTPPWSGPPAAQPVTHTPVWFMRQAGRSLPEYRAVREGVGMLESCRRPDLVTEITLQPVRRHGVDAAIFFSDIVVPLAAVGVDLDIVPGVGPVVAAADPHRAPTSTGCPSSPPTHVPDITESVRLLVAELGRDAADRLRRGAVHPGELPRRGRPEQEPRAHQGADVRRPASCGTTCAPGSPRSPARSCDVQAAAGASVVQLFDSWVGDLPPGRLRRRTCSRTRPRALAAVADLGMPTHPLRRRHRRAARR